MNKENEDNFEISHLIFGHSTYNERADHSRKCAHSIRNTHQYAGIPWRNVQVVDIKTLERGRIKKRNSEILGNIYIFLNAGQSKWDFKTCNEVNNMSVCDNRTVKCLT